MGLPILARSTASSGRKDVPMGFAVRESAIFSVSDTWRATNEAREEPMFDGTKAAVEEKERRAVAVDRIESFMVAVLGPFEE
jgi:hypothetical protein